MRSSDGVLDVIGSGLRSGTPNALFKSWFTQNFHWIFCHRLVDFGSLGLIIWNRAFSYFKYRYTKRTALRLEKSQWYVRPHRWPA